MLCVTHYETMSISISVQFNSEAPVVLYPFLSLNLFYNIFSDNRIFDLFFVHWTLALQMQVFGSYECMCLCEMMCACTCVYVIMCVWSCAYVAMCVCV